MSTDKPILTWENVTLGGDDAGRDEVVLEGVHFELGAGETVVVRIEEEMACPPLADAAQGLLNPVRGRILFMGQDWRAMDPDTAASNRGRIGRVYESHAWISNLDLDENITLGRRHHTRQPVPDILEEARAWARRFGLDDLPAVRPAWANRRERRMAQWVRALLGEPDLLLLERPTREAADGECAAWMEAVEEARAKGAAVMWVVSDERVWQNESMRSALHVTVRDGQWVVSPEKHA